ncbi:MAG: mandelate racemase/muconate lactonizing enzyme family protein [Chloroflexota bacterium]
MRVAAAAVEILDIPFAAPIATATGRWDRRRVGLLRLVSDDGLEGIGEVAGEALRGIDAEPPRDFGDSLVGLDVADRAALDARLARIDGWSEMGRPLRSALESAAVDLLARADGSSVAASMTANPSPFVRANALLGIDRAEASAVAARRMVARGFDCLKLKAGREPLSQTVDRVAAVRAAVGPSVSLRLDLNGSLDSSGARAALDALAAYALEYVEQPLAPEAGVAAMARLRRAVEVPIAADEAVHSLEAAGELIAAEAIDVLVLKPARVGGLRSAARIALLAAEARVPTVVSTLFETGIGIAGALQLAASLPGNHAHGLATAELLASDLLQESLGLSGGRMKLPPGPGLGVTLDQSALVTYRRR